MPRPASTSASTSAPTPSNVSSDATARCASTTPRSSPPRRWPSTPSACTRSTRPRPASSSSAIVLARWSGKRDPLRDDARRAPRRRRLCSPPRSKQPRDEKDRENPRRTRTRARARDAPPRGKIPRVCGRFSARDAVAVNQRGPEPTRVPGTRTGTGRDGDGKGKKRKKPYTISAANVLRAAEQAAEAAVRATEERWAEDEVTEFERSGRARVAGTTAADRRWGRGGVEWMGLGSRDTKQRRRI